MEKFYEITMKNGLSMMAITNENGFCEFSINGNEFTIFSSMEVNSQSVNLSVSAEREVYPGIDQTEILIDHEYTVLSIRTLNVKSLKGSKRQEIENGKALRESLPENKKTCISGEQTFFCARQGGIKTPYGWLFGRN